MHHVNDPKYPNGTTVVGQTTQTLTVLPQISDEICAGDQPESKVTTTEWVDGKIECDAKQVTQTRSVTTTPYKLELPNTWVLDEANAVTVEEKQVRELSADEQKANACPITVVRQQLAETGLESDGLFMTVGVGSALLIAGGVVLGLRRRSAHQ